MTASMTDVTPRRAEHSLSINPVPSFNEPFLNGNDANGHVRNIHAGTSTVQNEYPSNAHSRAIFPFPCMRKASDRSLAMTEGSAQEYALIISRIQSLLKEDDVPTEHAYDQTMTILESASARMRKPFPQGWVMSDDGGIRIEWTRGENLVTLVIPDQPSGKSYVFFETIDSSGTDYGADAPATAQALAMRLNRLLEANA